MNLFLWEQTSLLLLFFAEYAELIQSPKWPKQIDLFINTKVIRKFFLFIGHYFRMWKIKRPN